MFDNINKSKMSFEKYKEIKQKTVVQNYTERFKWVDRFLYTFSWFGNGVSIFLAFFFLQSLFFASFSSIGQSIWITLGIIFFLTMFELLKRYVFGMFSMESIKQKFNIFRGNMITFILGTTILIVGSFYFSLNGAKEFVDNQIFFETQTQKVMTSKVDSLNNVFEKQKEIYVKENASLRVVNDTLRNKLSTTPVTYRSIRKEYQDNINNNMDIINSNQNRIDDIEQRKKTAVEELKITEETTLSTKLSENKKNKITFIIISSIIELIIMMGIYYDKFYGWKSIKEYEESVISTPEFKQWYKYNYLLELILNSTKDIGEKIPSTDNLIDLAKIGKNTITKGDFDKFIKLLYYLEILTRDGNRRILNSTPEEAKMTLRHYFDIK
jgi:flagellar basal body-associated protein FliL